jgi:2-oxoglutarate/2-oxoacid ferredoxin oxidoreductase subunit alpha
MTELPLMVLNVQRGGPSTGLPTKPEQSDLLFSLFGRHGESPLPVVAASSPSDAFATAIEAARLALKYMTPVILLSDNLIANGSEPWKLPDLDALPDISVPFATRPNGPDGTFLPYERTSRPSLGRGRCPAHPGSNTASVASRRRRSRATSPTTRQPSADDRHRAWKIKGIANDIPPVEVNGDEDAESPRARLGLDAGRDPRRSPPGAAGRRQGGDRPPPPSQSVPGQSGGRARSYPKVLIPELNSGQLRFLIRANFLVPAEGINKVSGEPFKCPRSRQRILEMI